MSHRVSGLFAPHRGPGWRSPKGMSEVLAVSAKPKFDLDQGLPGAVKQLWDSRRGWMRWNQIYRFRYSVRSSLWIIPIIAIPFAMMATRLAHWLDPHVQWTFLGFGVKGAEALLQATVTATLSFLAFTFASLLVALQVASGQLTPESSRRYS